MGSVQQAVAGEAAPGRQVDRCREVAGDQMQNFASSHAAQHIAQFEDEFAATLVTKITELVGGWRLGGRLRAVLGLAGWLGVDRLRAGASREQAGRPVGGATMLAFASTVPDVQETLPAQDPLQRALRQGSRQLAELLAQAGQATGPQPRPQHHIQQGFMSAQRRGATYTGSGLYRGGLLLQRGGELGELCFGSLPERIVEAAVQRGGLMVGGGAAGAGLVQASKVAGWRLPVNRGGFWRTCGGSPALSRPVPWLPSCPAPRGGACRCL